MSEPDNKELQRIWCELALAWKLYDAAVRERRLEDAMAIARHRELIETRAKELYFTPRRT